LAGARRLPVDPAIFAFGRSPCPMLPLGAPRTLTPRGPYCLEAEHWAMAAGDGSRRGNPASAAHRRGAGVGHFVAFGSAEDVLSIASKPSSCDA
jgi:hypothetical protein